MISRWFLLGTRYVSEKNCRANRNIHFVSSNFIFLRKSCRLWENVEKYCRAWQATDGNIIRGMRFACLGYLRLQSHTLNVFYLLLFHGNSGYANAPRCYVIPILPVLFRCQEGSGFDYRHAGRRLFWNYRVILLNSYSKALVKLLYINSLKPADDHFRVVLTLRSI